MRSRRQINGPDAGVIHAPGLDQHDAQTLCGQALDTVGSLGGAAILFILYEDTDEQPTCAGCIRAGVQARDVLRGWRLPRRAPRRRRPAS